MCVCVCVSRCRLPHFAQRWPPHLLVAVRGEHEGGAPLIVARVDGHALAEEHADGGEVAHAGGIQVLVQAGLVLRGARGSRVRGQCSSAVVGWGEGVWQSWGASLGGPGPVGCKGWQVWVARGGSGEGASPA